MGWLVLALAGATAVASGVSIWYSRQAQRYSDETAATLSRLRCDRFVICKTCRGEVPDRDYAEHFRGPNCPVTGTALVP